MPRRLPYDLLDDTTRAVLNTAATVIIGIVGVGLVAAAVLLWRWWSG